MIIREISKKDLPKLAELYKQFWNEESNIEKMNIQFKKIKKANSHIILGAFENENMIGSVMGVICDELYGNCKAFMVIENMIVDNSKRKKGIGKKLIEEIEKIAKLRNCTQIILVTETNRKDACSFYESVGYLPEIQKGYKKKLNSINGLNNN